MTLAEGQFMNKKTDITLANAVNELTFHTLPMQPNIKHSLLSR